MEDSFHHRLTVLMQENFCTVIYLKGSVFGNPVENSVAFLIFMFSTGNLQRVSCA